MKRISGNRPGRPFFRFAALAALSAALAGCSHPPQVTALTEKEVGEIGSAASVLIFSRVKADVSIPNFQIDREAVTALLQKVLAARPGVNVDDPAVKADILNEVLTALFTDLGTYCKVADYSSGPKVHVSSGSGSYIDDAGTIVTNAHVVAVNTDDFAGDALDEAARNVLKAVLSSVSEDEINTWLSDESHKKIVLSSAKSLAADATKVTNVDAEYDVVDTVDGLFSSDDYQGFINYLFGHGELKSGMPIKKATIMRNGVGEPAPGHDVALLKVDPSPQFSIALSDSDPENSDDLVVVGYPGTLTRSSQDITQTVTSGKVTKLGTSAKGVKNIFFDATIDHGNSGGPILNQDGHLVGLATFSVANEEGKAISGENGGIAVSEIKPFLTKAGVTDKESELTKNLRLTLLTIANHRYKQALPLLEDLVKQKPQNSVLLTLKKDVDKAIATKQDETPGDLAPALIGGGIALVLIAAGLYLRQTGRLTQRTRGAWTKRAPQATPPPGSANPASAPPIPTPVAAAPPVPAPSAFVPPAPAPAYVPPSPTPPAPSPSGVGGLTIAGRTIPLNPGHVLTGRDLHLASGSPNAIFAEIVLKPGTTNEFGLRNRSAEDWTATISGRSSPVAPGSSVKLQAGLSINIAGTQVQIG